MIERVASTASPSTRNRKRTLRPKRLRHKRNERAIHRFVAVEERSMSIRKMIALHPSVGEHVNQPLGDAVHHLMYCAKMCASCADACLAEPMDMTQCIRVCL